MRKWTCLGWLALGASMFASACSSDEPSGQPSTVDRCNQACDRVAAKSCGDVVASACADTCTPDGVCTSQADAYFECVSKTAVLSCSGTSTLVSGCDSQDLAYIDCASCAATAGDGSCGTCTKTSCCSEVRAYNLASDIGEFRACLAPCVTQACFDNCVATFPVAGAAYTAAVACQDGSCTRACTCGAQASDDPCTVCVKANCCDLLLAYSTTSDVAAFDACLAPCTTLACVDACVASFPAAGAAYNELVTTCLGTTCAASCG